MKRVLAISSRACFLKVHNVQRQIYPAALISRHHKTSRLNTASLFIQIHKNTSITNTCKRLYSTENISQPNEEETLKEETFKEETLEEEAMKEVEETEIDQDTEIKESEEDTHLEEETQVHRNYPSREVVEELEKMFKNKKTKEVIDRIHSIPPFDRSLRIWRIYRDALLAAGKIKNINDVKKFVEEMQNAKWRMNSMFISKFNSHFARENRREMIPLYEYIVNELKLIPTVNHYNSLCTIINDMDTFERILDDFKRLRIDQKPTSIILNTKLRLMVNSAKSLEDAMKCSEFLTELMEEHKITVGQNNFGRCFDLFLNYKETLPLSLDILKNHLRKLVTGISDRMNTSVEGAWTKLLDAAGSLGCYEVAEEAWMELSRLEGALRGIHYHAIFAAYAVGREYEAAFRTVNEMIKNGITLHQPSLYILSDVISSNVEEIDRAYYALMDLHANQEHVDISCVNLILLACAIVKDLHRSLATFAELSKLKLKPNLESYNNLLLACQNTLNSRKAFEVYKDLIQNNFTPDAKTFLIIFRSMDNVTPLSTIEYYLKEMQKYHIKIGKRIIDTLLRDPDDSSFKTQKIKELLLNYGVDLTNKNKTKRNHRISPKGQQQPKRESKMESNPESKMEPKMKPKLERDEE